MTQTELAIKKIKKQISEIKILERKEKQKLEDNELKLSKLKNTLDKMVGSFNAFDNVNSELQLATQLRCINSWVESRAQKNVSAKRKSYNDMDDSYREQTKTVKRNEAELEELRTRRQKLEVELSQLEAIRMSDLET